MDKIFELVLFSMNDIDKMFITGEQKKRYVMNLVKDFIIQKWGEEFWLRQEQMIEFLIEFLIKISKKELLFEINNTLKKRCC